MYSDGVQKYLYYYYLLPFANNWQDGKGEESWRKI